MTTAYDPQIVLRQPPSAPALRAADRGVADALESVLAGNTRRVYAAQRARFDLALVAFLSDGGLRRSEAAALTWGDVQRWDDGSGRITVIRSKTDVEAAGAPWWLSPPPPCGPWTPSGRLGWAAVRRCSGCRSRRSPGGSSRSPRAAGLANWEFFSGHSERVGMARRMAQNGAPTHEIERQGHWKQGGGMVGRYTRGESAGSALRYL